LEPKKILPHILDKVDGKFVCEFNSHCITFDMLTSAVIDPEVEFHMKITRTTLSVLEINESNVKTAYEIKIC
jgi:hypothetical protein